MGNIIGGAVSAVTGGGKAGGAGAPQQAMQAVMKLAQALTGGGG